MGDVDSGGRGFMARRITAGEQGRVTALRRKDGRRDFFGRRRCSTEYIACWEGFPHLGDSYEAVGGARERDGERERAREPHTQSCVPGSGWVIPMRQ